MLVLGLMSGTSMDGLDCCLSNIDINENNEIAFEIIDSITYAYTKRIKATIIKTIENKNFNNNYLDDLLGIFFLNKTKLFLKNKKINLISSHGQTLSHKDGEYSIQIGNPKFMSEYYKIPVIYDFRFNDIENHGSGAPLVPYLDWILFKNYNKNVISINIGGISNITYIPKKSVESMVVGFDMGPGMCLIDLYVRLNWNMNFDSNGFLASKGKINNNLLQNLMNNKFIYKKPPKSTSVEKFNIDFLNKLLNDFDKINKYDFLRTLVNFTACTIMKNIELHINPRIKNKEFKIVFSGGGVKNKKLMDDLKNILSIEDISKINYHGITIDNKESFLMCVLGITSFKKIPNNMPSVTGANKKIVCGRIYE